MAGIGVGEQTGAPRAAPGPGDDVVIDTAVAGTIEMPGGSVEVNSITTGGNDTLSFDGGSLTVSADSTLDGPVNMPGGSLTASGSGTEFTVNGSISLANGRLNAEGGGELSLPHLTNPGTDLASVNASGSGSIVDLSALAGLDQTGNLSVIASQGGEIKLVLSRVSTSI